MKYLKMIFTWFFKIIENRKKRKLFKRAEQQLEIAYQKEIIARRVLRKHINEFLYDFFGINARSKYIPHDFKNKEEVKVAVIDKFGDRLSKLSLTYEDVFK